jgi:hypothetical protein
MSEGMKSIRGRPVTTHKRPKSTAAPERAKGLIDLERVESLGNCNTAGSGTWDIGFYLGGITVLG